MLTKKKNNQLTVYNLSLGHSFVDFHQGALAALLPFLIASNHLSYSTVALLILAMNLVSSVVQPIFGIVSDKMNTFPLLPISLIITSLGFVLLTFTDNFYIMLLCVVISGVGIAMYHPDAAKIVNLLSTNGKGKGMSIFSFGGNIGFAIGPVVTTFLVTHLSMKGINLLIIPMLCIAFLLFISLKLVNKSQLSISQNNIQHSHITENIKNNWRYFIILLGPLFARSIVFYGFNTFLVLYWIKELNQSQTSGSFALGLLFIVGALGTLLGGKLGDSLGYSKVIKYDFILLPIFIFIFVIAKNMLLSYILLIPIGLLIFISYSPIVILAQQYLKKSMGLASGVSLGLSVSVGGIVTPLLGKIGDLYNLSAILLTLGILALIAILPAFLLKDTVN